CCAVSRPSMPSMPGVAAASGSPPGRAVTASSSIGLQAARESAAASAATAKENGFMDNSSEDIKQLDVENQGGVGADRAAGGTAGTIAKLARDPETVLGAHRHQGDAFRPARDDL